MDLKINEIYLLLYFVIGEYDLLVVMDINDNDDKIWFNDV